jgi:pimeloyl-ACP methyl ester carboxylesterase
VALPLVVRGVALLAGRGRPMPDVGPVPPGSVVDLPGRGRTHVVDLPGPSADAPVILLLHGIATTGSLTWFSVLAELARSYRVITFDQRWHGRGIPSDTFLLDDCADDGVAVLDALGVDRAIVVGYSMGGATAQVLWHRHAERVAGLVLCSTAARWRGHLGERAFYTVLPAVNKLFLSSVPERVRLHAEGLPEVPLDSPHLGAWALAELRSTSPWVLPHVMAELGRFDARPWIGGVAVPTGMVITARDRAIPTARQRQLAELLPDAYVREAPGGHASLVFDRENWTPVFLEVVAAVARAVSQAAA